ncbi:cell division inhibitor SepF [Sediminihabitans luteus]|uniref:Cell division protein SepF n=1 Tax=Sediminihabitans luteus TaxID=1138585 RepID=A0A2M9CCL0_9CELL|nr:cell division protein SepF [Sediminihabitans luteus]PJJ69088.1 cell division inhibitor SepF [Sediminihabitans luteus]GII99474.1 cell division protein SepF [Sediminihabitans luteus]
MAGSMRKAMLYLGLADDQGENRDDEYVDDYDETETDVSHDFPAEVTPLHRAVTTQERTAHGLGADLRRITTVHPRSYNDARIIGEAFRGGTPVIMNLSDMDDADAKRLVDFSAGLIFGLHGALERVTNKVFLLSPEHVEVTGEEKAAPPKGQGAFYNQS